jgi:membrane-associated protein
MSRRRKMRVVLVTIAALVCLVAAVIYVASGDGIDVVDPDNTARSYLTVFLLIALDGVVPIFPGETTLNAASTAAAQGTLDLTLVIVMGFLGALVGDSALFWIARRSSKRIEPQVKRAQANNTVRQALAIMDSSAPLLIVGGRYVPGLRFVVNATMGVSEMPYRRFLPWSALSGLLWSLYTSVLAYSIGLALGEFPLASVVISGVITTAVIGAIFVVLRRHRQAMAGSPAEAGD